MGQYDYINQLGYMGLDDAIAPLDEPGPGPLFMGGNIQNITGEHFNTVGQQTGLQKFGYAMQYPIDGVTQANFNQTISIKSILDWVYLESDTEVIYRFIHQTSGDYLKVYVSSGILYIGYVINNSNEITVDTGIALSIDTTYFLAIVINTPVKLYLNGILQNSLYIGLPTDFNFAFISENGYDECTLLLTDIAGNQLVDSNGDTLMTDCTTQDDFFLIDASGNTLEDQNDNTLVL